MGRRWVFIVPSLSVILSWMLILRKLIYTLIFERGSGFPCPKCGSLCSVYDSVDRVWRHLDFFNHAAFIHARVPRILCAEHGVLMVDVPWARVGSKFSLLFETLVLSLAREMSVKSVALFACVNPNSVWRILDHYVERTRKKVDLSELYRVGVNEFAIGNGHEYASVSVTWTIPEFYTCAKARTVTQFFKRIITFLLYNIYT